ncbi:hypothetical protein GCM10010305_32580 [Streptomyces termitum]|uniref:LamG-like jellyroll fold domain-containing protein n=1 Tax=Streptomyces termitum TaxID=67368 RepID=A0A918WB45_9ACTN|nr:hypothetical protein GCM10010305_32580 [Streptomyces termitum]
MTLLAGVLPGLLAGPASAQESFPATEAERALRQAADSGARVEVVGERTERETVFANPDGASFTLEKSIIPVRVHTSDGWAAPDATLVRRADGSIGPKAAAVGMSFSAGGTGADLVTIGQEGRSVSMGWPGRLPQPRLDGERAIYDDVLPGVNLILTATVEGFRQVLEVESAQAAALPELKAIKYGLASDGLRLREGAVGSVEALDGNGQVVFRSPTARMWNSAGDTGVASADGRQTRSAGIQPSVAQAPTSQDPAVELVAPSQEGDPLAGPGAGDVSAVMKVDLTPDALTVRPDAELVTSTRADQYPLYIDPSVEMNESERTVLSSDGDVFYNFSGGTNGMSVGKCGSAVIGGISYYCGNGYVNRMYFEFTPDKLRGKHVLDATFAVTETWSFSCNARWVDLKRTNPISAATKWPGPAVLDHMGDRYVSAGRGTACSPAQPRAPIEFHDNPAEADENLTPTVRAFADGKMSLLTLRLSAQNETDTDAWKRFDDDAVIRVTYVGKPAVPAEHGIVSSSAPICSRNESAPTTVSTPKPVLAARPRLVPGGEAGAMLRLYFDVDGKNADGTWFDAPEPTTGSLAPSTGHVAYSSAQKDFVSQPIEWNVPLKEGTLYRFTVNTQSYPNTSYTQPLSSGGASWCYFKVDATAPKPPVVKFNTVYTECVAGGSCVPGGRPGQTGSFTFNPFPGDTNTHYQYRLSTDTVWSGWKAATAGSYTAAVTPTVSGSFVLNVQAKDVLGRVGETAVKFLVKEGEGAVGRWDFNEASGVALDRSTSDPALRNDLTLTPTGATRTDHGRRGELTAADGTTSQDKALALTNTAQGGASAAKQVVETQASYSVAAWARIDTVGSLNASVVSQDGARLGAFYLSYCQDVRTWCARLPERDADGAYLSGQRVNAVNPAQPKAWTHLGLVVDTPARKLSFYVNGVLQGTDDFTTGVWASTGGIQVGRAKYNGLYVDHFYGEIDEAAVWQRALSSEEMAKEAAPRNEEGDSAYVELVAQYDPSGASGTSLADSSGYGNTLTMTSAASLDGESIVLDGVDDRASTALAPLDDTGGFTVSTAVNVDGKKLKTAPNGTRLQVLGQQTATGSSWGIWFEKTGTAEVPVEPETPSDGSESGEETSLPPEYEQVPVGRWHFGRIAADGSRTTVQSDELLTLAGEVRLTGVFDARTRTITLYSGTALQDVPTAYTATVASHFTVGADRTGNTYGGYLPGTVSDIRLWAGAITSERQLETVVGS